CACSGRFGPCLCSQISTPPRMYPRSLHDALPICTFAETFPMAYGRKYHTATAEQMTTDWLGPRMYRPKLEEVLRGVLQAETDDVHYVQEFRYPETGGFVRYLEPFLRDADVQLGRRVTRVDPVARHVVTLDGATWRYDGALISSLPLPTLVSLIVGVPDR